MYSCKISGKTVMQVIQEQPKYFQKLQIDWEDIVTDFVEGNNDTTFDVFQALAEAAASP
jgi:hypothetical protein